MTKQQLKEQLDVLAEKITEMKAEGKDVADWLNYFTDLLAQYRAL